MPKKPRPKTKTFRCDHCGKKKRDGVNELMPEGWILTSKSALPGKKIPRRFLHCDACRANGVAESVLKMD